MILSMTGFGSAVAEYNKKRFTVEVKSLNSKQLDLSLRLLRAIVRSNRRCATSWLRVWSAAKPN